MAEPVPYLRLQARARADNVLRNVRMELTTSAGRNEAGDGDAAAWAELAAADDRLLLRWPMTGTSECTLGGEGNSDLLLRARVPLHADARKLRIVRHGVVLTEVPVSPDPPEAALEWTPSGRAREAGRQTIRWRSPARAADAFLKYSADDGRTWLRLGPRSTDGLFEIDFDRLPGGTRCRLALVVTANCRTTTVVSEPFQVASAAPQLLVTSPVDGSEQREGVATLLETAIGRLHGQPRAVDPPLIAWRSSCDGELGTGQVLRRVLSAGRHQLTATLDGNPAVSQTVTIEVRKRVPPASPLQSNPEED